MALPPEKIRNGFAYETARGQMRKVLKIARGRVYYMARGRQAGVGRWSIPHNLTNPPSLQSFANSVARRVIPCPADATPAAKEMRRRIRNYR